MCSLQAMTIFTSLKLLVVFNNTWGYFLSHVSENHDVFLHPHQVNQFSISLLSQHCDYALVRFRHHLVGVRKTSCFCGLDRRLEMIPLPKKKPVLVATKMAGNIHRCP